MWKPALGNYLLYDYMGTLDGILVASLASKYV